MKGINLIIRVFLQSNYHNTDKVRKIKLAEKPNLPAEDAKNDYNDLVLGFTGSASAHYRVSRDYWIGAQYLGFYSRGNMVTYYDEGGMYRFYGNPGD